MSSGSAIAALSIVIGLASTAAAQPATSPPPPAPAAAPVPSAPPAPPAPSAAPAAPQAPATPRPAAFAHAADARQGVVRLERGGRTLGLGAVLRSDGRILSALSALGHGNFIQARFSDDSVLAVRVVASDRAWDLALLAPEGGHWTAGLRPSVLEAPQPGGTLYRFRARGRLEETSLTVSARQSLLGRDGVALTDALVLSSRLNDDELGSPLFDERGEVAAIVVQACAPATAQSCQLSAFGAPVSALKQFLKKAPPREPLPAAWLGFRGVAAHDGAVAGVRVISVEPGGPAAQAGLRSDAARAAAGDDSGDLIVAVQDAPVSTPEEMRDAINRYALSTKEDAAKAPAGDRQVRLLVFGSGKFREVSLPLRAPRQLPQAEPAAAPPSAGSPPAPAPAPPAAPNSAGSSPAVTAPTAAPDKAK